MDLLDKNGCSIFSEEGKKSFSKMFSSEEKFNAFRTALEQADPMDLPPNLVKNEGKGAYSFFPECSHRTNPRICAYRENGGSFRFTRFSPQHNSKYSKVIQETREMAKRAKETPKLGPAVKNAISAGFDKMSAKAVKNSAKKLGKGLAKKIPLLGAILGGIFATQRAMNNDFTGAGMELASGVASIAPGAGTAASTAIDMALIARDMKKQR